MTEVKICKDCGRIIDGKKVRGMRCKECGEYICYKCNICYCCKDCYSGSVREKYYIDKEMEYIPIQNV